MTTSEELTIDKAELSKKSEQPVVSIIIMNYNYEQFLTVAIESCFLQTYPSVETIVVDDGSTDGSKVIIEEFSDRVIPVFKQNGGQASAINAGFKASSGDIICLLDADDLFLPERISTVVDLFRVEPQVGWVFTESAPVETERIALEDLDRLFDEVRSLPTEARPERVDDREAIRAGKISAFTPSTSNLCFSRKVFQKILPLPEIKGISGLVISDLYVKTIAMGLSFGYAKRQNLGVYRFHNNYYTSLDLDKKRRVFGEIQTTTGYWMKERFPELSKISQKFLAKGFSTYLSSHYSKAKHEDANCDHMVADYLQKSLPLDKIKLLALIAYYRFKLRFKSFV